MLKQNRRSWNGLGKTVSGIRTLPQQFGYSPDISEREREKVRERESTMNIRDEYVSQLHQLNDSDFKNISSNYVFCNV